MPKQTLETKHSQSLSEKALLSAKIIGATGVAAVVGYALKNSWDYGYHPNRNPNPPTYFQTHDGINPANIDHSSTEK